MTQETGKPGADLSRDAAAQAVASVDCGRRSFLGGSGLAAMGAVIGGGMAFSNTLVPTASAQGAAPAKGPQHLKYPGKNEGLVVLGERPLVAETPESLLDDDTTPTEKFYIRNNGQIPEPAKDPEAWKLVIDGEVNTRLELSLGELKSKYKPVTRHMVLECGGNGRAGFSPPARGNQWTNGGAGCAEWTGIALAEVLKAAGLKPNAKYTAHYSADLHLSGDAGKPSLSRGVRIEKALDPYMMLVWGMNGEALPNIHGGPLRLVVPGWPGSTSQKATLGKPKNKYDWQRWTATVRLPSDGYFEIWARATDSKGVMQPHQAGLWNPQGYGANAMHRIAVLVG